MEDFEQFDTEDVDVEDGVSDLGDGGVVEQACEGDFPEIDQTVSGTRVSAARTNADWAILNNGWGGV